VPAAASVEGVYDAIVLAGGAATRLGGADKPQLKVAGRSLLDRAVDAVHGAARIVVVGPEQQVDAAVTFCREDPPGGGPVAAIAATPLDRDLLLDVARDAAHGVARPAAPLTTFLVGYAAGLRGGGPAAVAEAAGVAQRLAATHEP